MRNVLVINFFPAFVPPQSGGELRYYNMYLNLSKYYNITLLSPTYRDHKFEVINHSETFREYRVPKEMEQDALYGDVLKEGFCAEVSALVCTLSARKFFTGYHREFQKLYAKADIIIHEFPYMLDYDMFWGLDGKVRIYNSHNFESGLIGQMWKGPNAKKYLDIITALETKLVRESDLVFATSQEEKESFVSELGGDPARIGIAPNGIDVKHYQFLRKNRKSDKRKKAFFIGSAHPPNMEAVEFIIKELAPACPDMDFYLAGKCCEGAISSLENVKLMGLIDAKQKDELFADSDIAINPMFSGAGTNLKALEFLSAGIPMISTYVGVRGLQLREGEHYIHAEKENFADKLHECLLDNGSLELIAQSGKMFINERYSWESICSRVHEKIEEACAGKKNRPPLALCVNDYEADKPLAGGTVRINNLFRRLSRTRNVAYICFTNEPNLKITRITDGFIHIAVPKSEEHRAEENRVNSLYWVSANDIVAGMMAPKNDYFIDVIQNFYQIADIVLIEHPFLVDVFDGLSGKPFIYESQNFETKMKEGTLANHPLADILIGECRRQEKKTLDMANLVISVSPDEVDSFKAFSRKENLEVVVVKNGVNVIEPRYAYDKLKNYLGGKPIVVFVGSGHSPNVESANYIVWEMARYMPGYAFAIIGSVCGAFNPDDVPENVLLFGLLSEEHKNFILFSSSVALNPIMEGAGSNLTLAEYFAFRVPTITTSFGARGYEIQNGREAIICERSEFADSIRKILLGKIDAAELTKAAYQYVTENLTWDNLARQYAAALDSVVPRRKLLAVTYRYNKPTRGGAEVYLDNILTRIARRGNYSVDVATTDIGDIINVFRFACDYTKDGNLDVADVPNFRCFKFPALTMDKHSQWLACSEIYRCFCADSVSAARRFLDRYGKPMLMGGWHFPEKYKGQVHIWSSGEADIYVRGCDDIKITGQVNAATPVTVSIDGTVICKNVLKGNFSLKTNRIKGNVVTISCEPFFVEDQDPRPLGLYVSAVECKTENQTVALDLSYTAHDFLKARFTDEYVTALIENASERSASLDELFHHYRGPESPALEKWLEDHMAKYDVVLGHSVPFATSIIAGRYAGKYGIPIVQLPHFHMEDDFYHWRGYYEMLSGADKVIAFPKAAIPAFFEKIGGKTEFLPGGGVVIDEFLNIDTSEFDMKYRSEEPFILVLGRKSGAKNYQWVVNAVDNANRRGCNLRLVIIGRDEDGEPVVSPNALYLGEQSRAAVLGALKRCRFVVNMSGSESFGIVILEAWLAGKPVIVNGSCAAFTELVEDGVNGLYASRENLCEKLIRLLKEDKIAEMGQNGMKKAQEGYTWDSIAEKLENVFNSLL